MEAFLGKIKNNPIASSLCVGSRLGTFQITLDQVIAHVHGISGDHIQVVGKYLTSVVTA